jgi:superfamily II DNA or RNA helicase
MKLSKDLDGM